MKFKLTALYIYALAIVLYPQDIKERAEEVITNCFSEEVGIELERYDIDKKLKNKIEHSIKQRFFSDHIFLFRIFSKEKLKAVGMLDNVYGKSQPITFMVIFDSTGSIISTNIIKYREPYGGGVANENWNNQFKGKNSNSSFEIGEEVNSISGATISVNSVTLGIKKLAILFDEIKKDI